MLRALRCLVFDLLKCDLRTALSKQLIASSAQADLGAGDTGDWSDIEVIWQSDEISWNQMIQMHALGMGWGMGKEEGCPYKLWRNTLGKADQNFPPWDIQLGDITWLRDITDISDISDTSTLAVDECWWHWMTMAPGNSFWPSVASGRSNSFMARALDPGSTLAVRILSLHIFAYVCAEVIWSRTMWLWQCFGGMVWDFSLIALTWSRLLATWIVCNIS